MLSSPTHLSEKLPAILSDPIAGWLLVRAAGRVGKK